MLLFIRLLIVALVIRASFASVAEAGAIPGVVARSRSQVAGAFRGWAGATVVQLQNGQVWEQSEYYYEYVYFYAPEVIIFESYGSMMMLVDGVSRAVRVRLVVPSTPSMERGSAAPPLTVPSSGLAESRVDGQFNGWSGSTVVKLQNGQIWQQSEPFLELSLSLAPTAIVYTSQGSNVMYVDGTAKAVGVRLIASSADMPTGSAVQSKIDGEFEGWDGETIFILVNGQIWQQSSYSYLYHYAYNPSVLIYQSGGRWMMSVEGVNRTIAVTRLY